MKIIGGHDYYDVGLSMGIDPLITLVRYKDERIQDKDCPPMFPHMGHFRTEDMSMRQPFEEVKIIVCDKMYYGVKYVDRYRYLQRSKYDNEWVWSLDRLNQICSEEKRTLKRDGYRWWHQTKDIPEDPFIPAEIAHIVKNYMIEHKLSIVLRTHEGENEKYYKVNPFGLKQYGLAKALDPWKAFTELSMWIGGVLGGSSPQTIRITDDRVLAESHGFDKYSFRGPRLK